MKTNSLLASINNSRFCLTLRPIMFGLTIGLGIGLATKNLGVGIALGVVFAFLNGGCSCRAK